MTQVKKTCGFYVKESSFSSTPPSHDLKKSALLLEEYEETKKGKVRRKYINAMCCGKKIYTERGGDPLCEEHFSEEFAIHLKNQRRLKRLYQNHDNQADRGGMFGGDIKAGTLLIAPALIWFLLIFMNIQDSFTVSNVAERGVWTGSGIDTEFYDTGRTSTVSHSHPTLLKFLTWIWLCVPTYYVIFAFVGNESIFEIILKSTIMLAVGFVLMWIVYLIMGLFLTAF